VIAVLLGLVVGAVLGLLMAVTRNAPVLPFTVATALLTSIVMPLVVASMHADLRLARLGTLEEKRARAAQRIGPLSIASSRAAVAIEAGDLGAAAAAMARIPRLSSGDGNVSIVVARYAHARGEAGALDRLLAWSPPALRGRAFIGETRRYHAYVVAKALASERNDERRSVAAARLLASPDPEIRAYGAWLVALDDDAAPPRALQAASADFAFGAALARHEGLHELGTLLEVRASKLALEGRSAPYRG
jgi:hypothetical protein